MDIRNYENRLRAILQQPLKIIGFLEQKHLFYTMDELSATKTLAFGGRLDSNLNQYMFACTVGIRFIEIEEIYRPQMLNEITRTIMIPLHLLHEDRIFFEWLFDENESDTSIKERIIREIKLYALPFFEKFSTIENVKCSLESSSPENWFVLNPEQRICILGIITYIQGNLDRAIEIIDNALEERKDDLPKKRRLLEQIHRQLIEK